jgi:hypothetical protein
MAIEEIERQARMLATENRQAEPLITKMYWFPDENEVRLVGVLSAMPIGDGRIHPYFFRPAPQQNLPAPSGVALVRPEEVCNSQLPEEWGDWEDAVELEADE